MTAQVGQKAPDFTAPTYHNGGFSSFTLSDCLGKMGFALFLPW